MAQALTTHTTWTLPRVDLRDWRPVLLVVLFLAVVVRVSMLGFDSLSHAEAGRANDARWATLSEMRWYPPLQYAVLWAVRSFVGKGELVLRLPSALAGVACVAVLFMFTRRYVDAWSGVCVAGVAAFHAELVTQSRIMKEFSIEALMAIILMWAGLAAATHRTTRSLITFAAIALLAMLLTYTAPLIAASWLLVIGFLLIRNSETHKQIPCFVGVAIALAIGAGLSYLWLSGAFNKSGAYKDYGIVNGAWPIAYDVETLALWVVAQSYGAMRFVLGISPLYAPIDALIGGYEILLIAVAVTVLYRRVPALCAATVVLVLLTMVAGAARFWPFGNFHTQTFLVPLVCVAVGCGLRRAATQLKSRPAIAALVLVCLINPAARAVKNTVVSPPVSEHLRPVLEYVNVRAERDDGIFVYYAAAAATRYYWERRDIGILTQTYKDRGHVDRFLARFDRFMADHNRVWFVSTHDINDERKTWTAALQRKYTSVDEYESEDAAVTLFVSVDRAAMTESTKIGRSVREALVSPQQDATAAISIRTDSTPEGAPN